MGVCFEKHPRYIVLELLVGGDLKTFLREARPKPVSILQDYKCKTYLKEAKAISTRLPVQNLPKGR